MKRILDYLSEHGTLHVSGSTVEEMYSNFSEDRYCAGWMGVVGSAGVDFTLLEEFSDWLAETDL